MAKQRVIFRDQKGRFAKRHAGRRLRLEVRDLDFKLIARKEGKWTKRKVARFIGKVKRERAIDILEEAWKQLEGKIPSHAEITHEGGTIVKVSIRPGRTPPTRPGALLTTTWFTYDVETGKTIKTHHGKRRPGGHW